MSVNKEDELHNEDELHKAICLAKKQRDILMSAMIAISKMNVHPCSDFAQNVIEQYRKAKA